LFDHDLVVARFKEGVVQSELLAAWNVDGGGIGHFTFRLVDEEDLYRAVEEVERAEGGWSGEGEHPDGQPFAYVTDPDGYVIEL
jgi:catechol 2,3-dioxygenase-like lactoylglutathione lyase family enzyme